MRSFDLGSAELVVFELLALLFPLVLATVLFFVVSSGVRRAMSANGPQKIGGIGASSKEMLDRRYASGEITREEYLNIRDDITRNGDA